MPNLVDWSTLQAELAKFRSAYSLQSNAEALLFFLLDAVLKIGGPDIEDSITDGASDRGIDALYIDTRGARNEIHLFQAKHVSKFENSTRNFPGNECDKIISFVADLLQKSDELEASCNPALWAKVQDVWAALDGDVFRFVVNLGSNSGKLEPSQLQRLSMALRPYKNFTIRQFDLETCSDLVVRGAKVDRELSLQIVGEQIFERTDGYVRGLISTVGGGDYVEFAKDKEFSAGIDESLFEENIRVYLGENNAINGKIIKSALSENSNEFWYLNNGITIVCDHFEYQPKSRNPVVKMKNPQIVNGGQTSHALFEARKKNSEAIEDLRVIVRIIETKNPELVNKIAEATNSRTPIRSRDLRSNDDIQQKLEAGIATYGYYYERKRNQHIEQAADKRIDALRAGQLLLSYYRQEPDRAKTQSDKIFGELYDLIFDPNEVTAEKIITVFQLYMRIDEYRRQTMVEMRRARGRPENEWIVEGTFHVLFLVGHLCERAGASLADLDAAFEFIPRAIEITNSYVKSQKRASYYRLFRSASTKMDLRLQSPTEQLEFRLDR